jgi:hypothetical protein
LPAQAVACRLAGLPPAAVKLAKKPNSGEEKEPGALLLEDLVKDQKFRLRVESVGKDGLCLVQASTLDRPAASINQLAAEWLARLHQLSLASAPTQLLITHFHTSNAFYGQPRYRYRYLVEEIFRTYTLPTSVIPVRFSHYCIS